MKKVLIIGFFWPYIGGSKRVIGLAKYLSDFNWQPLILTPRLPERPPSEFRVIETDYICFMGGGVKALGLSEKSDLGNQLQSKVKSWPRPMKSVLRWGFNFFKEIAAYPDEHKKWGECAISAAKEIIAKERIDALLSVWPVTTHLVARNLKLKHSIPWVADFADLWSDNSAYPYGRIRQRFDQQLERKTIHDADVLTTSSWPLAERMSQFNGGRIVHPIMLGYDPQLVNQKPENLRRPFTVTYTGIFYSEKRDPHVFLKALQELIAERRIDLNDIEVRFYGAKNDWVGQEIRKCRLEKVVKQCGSVPLNECLRRQWESHVLLQVNWSDKNEKGVFSGKFLDYLAAQRPILAAGGTGNDEVVIKILRETQAGVYAVTKDEIKSALEDFYNEYKRTGMIRYRGNSVQIDNYSNRSMAREFGMLLNSVSERNIA